MHRLSALSVVLAGASVVSLARAQVSSGSDEPVTLIETAPTGVITSVVTSVVTETPTLTDSPSTVIVTKTSTDSSAASRTSSNPEPRPNGPGLADAKRIMSACYPGLTEQHLDFEAPCAAVQVIQAECSWGPEVGQMVRDVLGRVANGEEPTLIPDGWEQQPLDTQRACLCSSSFTEMVLGCGACLNAHGVVDQDDMAGYLATSNATAVQGFREIYCAADVAPTGENGFDAYAVLLESEEASDDSDSSSSSASVTASDSLGTATAISLYFTSSVSSAYTVDMPTASSSGNHSNAWYTYTSLSTSDGLIVPTAFDGKRVTASPPSGSQSGVAATGTDGSTTTAAAGAMKTAMAYSGFGAGAFGIAALAFAL